MRAITLPLVAISLTFTLGCGATRTAGTEGIAKDQLAILHVKKQYDVRIIQLVAIGFDNGEKYAVNGERDFYLRPGVHHIDIDLATKIESPIKGISFGETRMQGPKGLMTGKLEAGKTYELRGLASGVQGMLDSGELAITQERVTR